MNQQHWQAVLRLLLEQQEPAQLICISSASEHNGGMLVKAAASRDITGCIFYIPHYFECCLLTEAGRVTSHIEMFDI